LLATRALHQCGHAGQGIKVAHDGRGVAQVFDGLEQRHHDQVVVRLCVQCAAHQAHFLLQQQHFEQVAHGFGVADDVVADRLLAKGVQHALGGFKDGQLRHGVFAVVGTGHTQWAGVVQQTQQQGLLGVLVELAVVFFHAGGGEQFGHHFFVLVRALTQVHRGQVKAKHLHGADQWVQALCGHGFAVVAAQGRFDHAQVGQKFFGAGVGVLWGHGMACGLATGQVFERGGQAGVDAGERSAVRFVLAVLVGVGRFGGQGLHLGAKGHQHGRQRQLAAQVVHFGQVVAQGHIALAGQGVFQCLGGHVGVAVAVAADPLTHAQKAGNRLARQGFFQLGVQLGDFAQEGGFVIAQRVFNLVGHGEFGEAQQARLPQLHHAGAHLLLVGGQLFGCQGVLGSVHRCGAGLDGVAFGQQVGDVALGVQNAFALHFGRVGGEHGRDVAGGQHVRDAFGRDARPAQALQRHVDAAFLRVACALVDGAAADVVAVFGQVGQVTEVSEGADHADGAVTGQAFEQLFQRLVGLVVGVTAEGHRQLADLLDQLKGLGSFLHPDHVAQDAAKKADVFDQRTLAVALVGFAGADVFGKRGGGFWCGLFHRSVCGEGWFGKLVGGACGAVPHASIGQPLEITNWFHLEMKPFHREIHRVFDFRPRHRDRHP
jgi:hypothetical protein